MTCAKLTQGNARTDASSKGYPSPGAEALKVARRKSRPLPLPGGPASTGFRRAIQVTLRQRSPTCLASLGRGTSVAVALAAQLGGSSASVDLQSLHGTGAEATVPVAPPPWRVFDALVSELRSWWVSVEGEQQPMVLASERARARLLTPPCAGEVLTTPSGSLRA